MLDQMDHELQRISCGKELGGFTHVNIVVLDVEFCKLLSCVDFSSILSLLDSSSSFWVFALLSFVFSLVVRILINNLLSLVEVLLDLVVTCDWTLHPLMVQDIIDGESVRWVRGHHLLEEVLKLW